MDDKINVVQSGIYQFNGTETINLSSEAAVAAAPIHRASWLLQQMRLRLHRGLRRIFWTLLLIILFAPLMVNYGPAQTLIQTQTLSSAAASVTFGSIPQTYTSLFASGQL